MKYIVIIVIVLSSILTAQTGESDSFIIKVEPVKPSVLLTRKKSKIAKFKFFRSFKQELIKSSENVYRVKIDGKAKKVEKYSSIARKERIEK